MTSVTIFAFLLGCLDCPANFLLNMSHELGVSFHSRFALNAARYDDSAAALCDGWRIGHEGIELVTPEFGANGAMMSRRVVTSAAHHIRLLFATELLDHA